MPRSEFSDLVFASYFFFFPKIKLFENSTLRRMKIWWLPPSSSDDFFCSSRVVAWTFSMLKHRCFPRKSHVPTSIIHYRIFNFLIHCLFFFWVDPAIHLETPLVHPFRVVFVESGDDARLAPGYCWNRPSDVNRARNYRRAVSSLINYNYIVSIVRGCRYYRHRRRRHHLHHRIFSSLTGNHQ